jgi:roadblock/LC7 domain-containing protein
VVLGYQGKREEGGEHMATLDELLDIEGVVAAGEYTPDGRLVDYKAKVDMSQEMAEMTAQFSATVTIV